MLSLMFPRLWLALGWFFVVLALIVCLAPSNTPGLTELFSLNDKVEHALGYVALTLWFTGLYSRARYVWIAAGLFSMGVAVELMQGWMAMGRQADVFDVLANTTGIVVGIILALLIGSWTQRVEALLMRQR